MGSAPARRSTVRASSASSRITGGRPPSRREGRLRQHRGACRAQLSAQCLFLSPKLNRRDDQFGGSGGEPGRVARTVLRTVRRVPVGPETAVTAKLNMSDGGGRRPVGGREPRGGPSSSRRTAHSIALGSSPAGSSLVQPDVPLPQRRAAVRSSAPRCQHLPGTAGLPLGHAPTFAPITPSTREAFFLPSRASSASAPLTRRRSSSSASITELVTIRVERLAEEASRSSPWPGALLREPDPRPAACRPAGRHPNRSAFTAINACRPSTRGRVVSWWTFAVPLSRDRRPAPPRGGLLELSSQRAGCLLVAEAAHELHADRQPRSAGRRRPSAAGATWPVGR